MKNLFLAMVCAFFVGVSSVAVAQVSDCQLLMEDSYGDGWNGNTFIINDENYTLQYGSEGLSDVFALDLAACNEYAVDCLDDLAGSNGCWPEEVSWTFLCYEGWSTVEVASGGAPEVGFLGDCDDECGVFGGDNSSCVDECGVPNGDNSSCADECGVPNGDFFCECDPNDGYDSGFDAGAASVTVGDLNCDGNSDVLDVVMMVERIMNGGTWNGDVCYSNSAEGMTCEQDDLDAAYAEGAASVTPEDGIGQSDVDAAYVEGAASVTPEDGIGQSDVDAAYAEGAASVTACEGGSVEVNDDGYCVGVETINCFQSGFCDEAHDMGMGNGISLSGEATYAECAAEEQIEDYYAGASALQSTGYHMPQWLHVSLVGDMCGSN